jgi:hypothetical protein
MLNSGSYDQLLDWLTLDMGFDVPLSEAIILKGIKPLFYSKKFNTVGCSIFCKKLPILRNWQFTKQHRTKFSTNLPYNVWRLAPELSLLDTNGNIVGWETLKENMFICASPDQTMKNSFLIRFDEGILPEIQGQPCTGNCN